MTVNVLWANYNSVYKERIDGLKKIVKDFNSTSSCSGASLVAQTLKNPPAVQGTRVWSPDWDNPLEKGMAAHSSILAWRMLWTEEAGGLQSMSSQTVGHDWVTNTYFVLNIRVSPDSIKVSDLKNIVKLFFVLFCHLFYDHNQLLQTILCTKQQKIGSKIRVLA